MPAINEELDHKKMHFLQVSVDQPRDSDQSRDDRAPKPPKPSRRRASQSTQTGVRDSNSRLAQI